MLPLQDYRVALLLLLCVAVIGPIMVYYVYHVEAEEAIHATTHAP